MRSTIKSTGFIALILSTGMLWMTTTASADTSYDHRMPNVLKKAERALNNEQPERAMDLLSNKIEGMRHSEAQAQGHALMCSAQYQTGDYQGAEKSCDLAISTDPTNWSHINNRGVMRFMLGRYGEAVSDFRRAASLVLPATREQSRTVGKNLRAAERRVASN